MNKTIILSLSVIMVLGTVLTSACENSARTVKSVVPQEAFAIIQENQDNPDFVVLDVRTAKEFAEGHLENAILVDFYTPTFRDDINQLDKNKKYVIYCRGGSRSGQALSVMYELGFVEVYNVLDGIVRWQSEGLPMVK
jgi:rhodanese-related sulfurtransferase